MILQSGNAAATIDDLGRPGFEPRIDGVRYYYTDAYEYEQIMKPLVQLEVSFIDFLVEASL